MLILQRVVPQLVLKYLRQVSVIWLLAGICGASVWADTAKVMIPQSSSHDINHEDYYFSQLLILALRKTEAQYGPFQLQEADQFLVDKRLRTALNQGKVDVIWTPTSPEFEQQMLPVRVSLLKGLNDFRLLLIRKDQQAIFSQIRSLDDLRKLKGGMSSHWTDARVMRDNNLPLVEVVGYGRLFKMLAAGRFDYFSRGLYQIQSEVNFYPELQLQIEQDLILSYPNKVYFFVNRDNHALAERIETGLKLAQKDGSFDQLFNSIPRYRWGMDLLKNHQRRVLVLQPLQGAAPPVNKTAH